MIINAPEPGKKALLPGIDAQVRRIAKGYIRCVNKGEGLWCMIGREHFAIGYVYALYFYVKRLYNIVHGHVVAPNSCQ